jgi:hypothetical protein
MGSWWVRNGREYQHDATRVTIAVLVLACFLKCALPAAGGFGGGADKVAKTLVGNAQEFFALARQDQALVYRVRHAAMSVANIQAARQLYDDATIERSTGVDTHALLKDADALLTSTTTAAAAGGTAQKARPRLPVWP